MNKHFPLMLMALMILCLQSFAKKKHTVFRVQMYYNIGFPMGGLKKFYPAPYISSFRPGHGGGLGFNVSVYKRWHVGFQFVQANYRGDDDAMKQCLYNNYANEGYYTTVSNGPGGLSLVQVGLTVSYRLKTKLVEFEPFIYIAGTDVFNAEPTFATILQKKKGSNENDRIDIRRYATGMFYPAIGIAANKRIAGPLFVSASVRLSCGQTRSELIEERTDFFGNFSSKSLGSSSETIISPQGTVGIQFMFGGGYSKY